MKDKTSVEIVTKNAGLCIFLIVSICQVAPKPNSTMNEIKVKKGRVQFNSRRSI